MSATPWEQPTPPWTVVLVDDTPDLRDLLTMALERRGLFQVVGQAADGRAGIERVGATQPDVVLLDIAMPVMDGLEALPAIKAVCPRACVVMLSGFGAQEMTARALALGADGYLQKGLSIRQLHDEVQGYAERASLRLGPV